jgi:hypothetical protein
MASTGSNSSAQDADAAAARADIVVALTSHNDARTIVGVARGLLDGVARSFASSAVRFVLADEGSTDGTCEAAREILGPALVDVEYERATRFRELPYHGQPGRAAALRAILQTAQRSDAQACAVIDASAHLVEPELVERLIAPVMNHGFDYVSPYYVRQAHEGAITKSIVYPVFRALYGVRMRQPTGSEFVCSGRLVAHYLEQEFWELEQAPAGIDLWLAVAAVCGEFRTSEATLGSRLPARGSPADLSTTLAQVVGALFLDLEHRVDVWQRVRGSAAIPSFGGVPPAEMDATPPAIDALIESFRLGYRELREIWTWILPPRTIVELRKLTETPPERLRFDDRFWAGVVYDFALGYGFHVLPHDHLLRSLTPLYAGWLASFLLQMRNATLAEIEERVEQVCLGFESEKRYLISRWRWPERRR